MPAITPSQTVGPFFAFALTPEDHDFRELIGNKLASPEVAGERIRIDGRVLDGDNRPVEDAMIEIWQADGAGRYAHSADVRAGANAAFKGFGRCGTDENGTYRFETIKPGTAPGPNGKIQAPHILVAVFARGMLRHCYTRMYFCDEAANGSDPILALVPQERRATLIAIRRSGEHSGYRFDIHLQGERETVFFDV